jgi:hypothetical protein
MLNEGTPFKRIAESLNISDLRQLKRMMSKAMGYKIRVYHRFTTSEMSNTIEAALPIREHGANWGIRHVRAALARVQIRAPRRTVERALQIISEAHYNRRRRALLIVRRQYNVTIPMALWLNSYEKLVMFGIRIHGCIDGASHYVLDARVTSNKTHGTLFEPFSEAVQKFGPPLRVRSDFAAEHALIRRYMLEVRSGTRNPFLVGSFVHNQQIEH